MKSLVAAARQSVDVDGGCQVANGDRRGCGGLAAVVRVAAGAAARALKLICEGWLPQARAVRRPGALSSNERAAPMGVAAHHAWLVGRRVLRNQSSSPWGALLAGWGILRLVALVPVVGGLVGLAATAVGLEALTVALWRARRPGATPARPEAPAAGRPAPAA
jgi:hypothetical protein